MTVAELRKALGAFPGWTIVVLERDGYLTELQRVTWTDGNTADGIRFEGGGADFVELHSEPEKP